MTSRPTTLFAPQWDAKKQFDAEENILFCQRGCEDLQVRKSWKCRCRWLFYSNTQKKLISPTHKVLQLTENKPKSM